MGKTLSTLGMGNLSRFVHVDASFVDPLKPLGKVACLRDGVGSWIMMPKSHLCYGCSDGKIV